MDVHILFLMPKYVFNNKGDCGFWGFYYSEKLWKVICQLTVDGNLTLDVYIDHKFGDHEDTLYINGNIRQKY